MIALYFYLSGLARWAFMHCIGSSLCFWINTIFNETVDTLVGKLTKEDDGAHYPYESYNSIVDLYGTKKERNFGFLYILSTIYQEDKQKIL